MKTKSTILFTLIILLVALFSYVAVFGISIGNFTINPYSEDLELGLDLKGGVYVVLEAQTDITGSELDKKMQEAKLIIEERVNGLGVSEPNITIENGDRIRVELAGLDDPQEAIDLIGKTALLQFIDPNENVILTGEHVKEAEAILYENKPAVSLKFDSEGTKIFKDATAELAEKFDPADVTKTIIKIVLDGKVMSDPYVSQAITTGESVISGSFTQDEAFNLATAIRAGALPVDLKELEVSAIGPTLGLESFDKSVLAAGIGIVLIFLFMIIIYRLPGLMASIALTIYTLIVLGVMIAIHAKLTLPGIAGLILSIGMAVDANVVIFERIKEELKTGKTIRVAVKSGFNRALTSIIDANVTTAIAGLVLLYFGSGMIKGFAVTLLIGLVVSVITAVVITRILLNLIIGMGIAKNNKLFGACKVMKINIVKNMKIFIAISVIIILAGLLVAIFAGFNTGIDFTGGTLMQIDFGKKLSVSEIREVTDTIDKTASIVHIGDEQNQVIIRTAKSLDNEERLEFFNLFKEKYQLSDEALINQRKFEAAIGGETRVRAVISVAVATICMLIYISIRFEFKFGVAAIIALIHDVLIGIAVYALLRIPINSSFIAAMLTIVGYSINDTIVVFDRVRENTKLMRKETFSDIVNVSVGQTIKRSINTSVTTLLAIASLYVFGVESIKEFALPLIIGIIAGTYSSIFIASSVWHYLSSRKSNVNYYNPNKLK